MQSIWPTTATKFTEEGATVPFVTYTEENKHIIGFDSRECVPPEPMVNAMLALRHIKDTHTQVVMVNHRSPVGLLAKIGEDFKIETEELKEGAIKLVFSYKAGFTEHAELNNTNCAG
jgi:hypothetical protein